MTTKNLNARITALEARTPDPITQRYFAQYGAVLDVWPDAAFDAWYGEMEAAYPVQMAALATLSDTELDRMIARRS